jgi:SepF-like predicted cell division protein (DUF552 family)
MINYPSVKTVMSKNHKLYYKGRMTEAYKFVGNFKRVKKISYKNEILYNILLENHSTMNINNLICETLDPNHIIAKLSSINLDDKDRDDIIMQMNNLMMNYDYNTYKKITMKL